jgi:hypothetical protein
MAKFLLSMICKKATKVMNCRHKKIKNNQVTADAENFMKAWVEDNDDEATPTQEQIRSLSLQGKQVFWKIRSSIEVLGISGHLVVLNFLVTTNHQLSQIMVKRNFGHTLPAILVTLKISSRQTARSGEATSGWSPQCSSPNGRQGCNYQR